MLGAMVASAAALVTPQPLDNPLQRTVMFVEMDRVVGDRGFYYPPDMAPDDIPWSVYLIAQVRPVQRLFGRRYAGPLHLEYVAHAAYIRGVVFLVIAEPSRRGPELFARWYSSVQDRHGRYCVPEQIINELDVRHAFRNAVRVTDGGQAAYCVRSNLVTRD